MSSTDPKPANPAVSRPVSAEELAQASAANDLQTALQRIASHIGDVDRRHSRSLDDMQAQLDQVGRRVDQARTAAAEPHAGTLGRLEQEIAALSDRIASFGQARQSQKGDTPADREPWDAQSAEALTQAYEMMQAELAAGRRGRRAPEPARSAPARYPVSGLPTSEQGSAIDKAWLDSRLAGIAVALQQSLAENNPAKSLAALGQRLDQMEARLETRLGDVSARLGSDWLQVVEDHVKELSTQFEATSRQLARLDTIDGQLQQITRALDEKHQSAQTQQPSGLAEEAIEALIDSAAERAVSRLAATLPAPEAERGHRIDALEGMMQDYIAERRRGEETTAGMLHTIEEALIRIIDRIDAIEAPAPGVHGGGEAADVSGMDLEGARLAEAYATGARVLGQSPAKPTLDASDYVPSSERRQEPSLAGEPVVADRDAGADADAAAAEAAQARQELRASAMRAKVKAQAAPEETAAAGPSQLRADAPMAGDKPSKSSGGFRSRLLIGGAMALLFSAGYLTVDRLIARGVPAGEQQAATPNPQAGTRTGVAPGPSQPSARSTIAEPQAEKPAIAPTAKEDTIKPVPVPQPAERKTPAPAGDTNQVEQGTGQKTTTRHLAGLQVPEPVRQPAAEPAAVAPQDPAAAALQDGQLAGAAPTIDALPTGIGSNALREAAVKGDPTAQFEIATRFAEGNGVPQDQKQAFAWYERAAMRGLASSQFRLGAYYERGIGVTADAERAKVWYRRAADQGHVRAMHNLGVLVAGRGQEQGDYAGASHWFKEAAKRGYVDSQFNLATLYAHGRGVPKDLVESYMWFALAARSGDAGSLRRLEEIKAQLDPLEIEVAERKLVAWRAEGAEAPPVQASR